MLAFIGLIIKNVRRQKTRTALTVLGISLGIATIVVLGILTGGLKKSYEGTIKSGQADFTMAQANVADFSFSSITDGQLKRIRSTKGVKNAVGVLMGFAQTQKNPFFTMFGIAREDIGLMGVKLTKGRYFKDDADELVAGKIAVKNMKLKVGRRIVLRGRRFKVVGAFESGSPMQDGGALIPLRTLQEMDGKKNKVTMALITAVQGVRDIPALATRLEKRSNNELVSIVEIADVSSVDSGFEMIDFLSAAISLLAVIIGGIGVMNTVMMSVFERTHEIGVLRAVGWKRRRVLTMILGESLLLGGLSIVIGTGIGLIVIQYVMTYPVMESFFSPDYSTGTFERAVAVGLLVSLLGGLYPAWRATRFSPAEALRYE